MAVALTFEIGDHPSVPSIVSSGGGLSVPRDLDPTRSFVCDELMVWRSRSCRPALGDPPPQVDAGRGGLNMYRAALMLMLVFGLAACGGLGPFTESSEGEVVQVHVGDTFQVQLPGNPTTGYTWEVVPADVGVCVQVGEPVFTPESDLVGAPGTFEFTFEITAVGSEDLSLVYQRPWEEDVEPLDTYTLRLEASA
jgi:inhibitor of cysteine peptidase